MSTHEETFAPIATPTTPSGRLRLAAMLASDVMVQRHLACLAQTGEGPVLIVATADSSVGQRFIAGHLGAKALACLTGPVVIAQSEESFLATFSETDREPIRKQLADLDAKPDAIRIVYAVNGERLDFRVIHAPSPEALVACATPEGAAAWHAAQKPATAKKASPRHGKRTT